MSRTYRVTHRTSYRYSATMSDGYTMCCVHPRDSDAQHVVDAEHEHDVDDRAGLISRDRASPA